MSASSSDASHQRKPILQYTEKSPHPNAQGPPTPPQAPSVVQTESDDYWEVRARALPLP